MSSYLSTPARGVAFRTSAGFTLIEVMIVVALLGILAGIAIPNYSDYIRRGEAQEAGAALADYRVRLEQFYQDNRGYGAAGATACGVVLTNPKHYSVACALGSSTDNQSYLITATGSGGASSGNEYTLNQANVQGTTRFKGTTQSGKACWLIRGNEC